MLNRSKGWPRQWDRKLECEHWMSCKFYLGIGQYLTLSNSNWQEECFWEFKYIYIYMNYIYYIRQIFINSTDTYWVHSIDKSITVPRFWGEKERNMIKLWSLTLKGFIIRRENRQKHRMMIKWRGQRQDSLIFRMTESRNEIFLGCLG